MASLLVVDDDRDLSEAIAAVMTAEGHEVRTAYHGGEGLKHIHDHWPDLILLDVEMPEIDGPGMIGRLNRLRTGRTPIPIVVMSGLPEVGVIAETIGTPLALHKPFAAGDLIQLVERVLRQGPGDG